MLQIKGELNEARSELTTASEVITTLKEQYEKTVAESKAALAEIEARLVGERESALNTLKVILTASCLFGACLWVACFVL